MINVDVQAESETFDDTVVVERNASGDPIWLGNVRDVHGYLCSGFIKQTSNPYHNTIMIEDAADECHILYKEALGLSLGRPTKTHDQRGNKRSRGGFIQPMRPVKKSADQSVKRRRGITT